MLKKYAFAETKSEELPSDVSELIIAAHEKNSGVGQLLSIAAAHGALVRSETSAVPSKMSGSENAGGNSRKSLGMIFHACNLRPASGTRSISESTLA